MLKYGQFKFFNLEISVLNEIDEFDFFDGSLVSISEKPSPRKKIFYFPT
jgi:hypothetical protein